uniref:cytochrome c biogenesis protein n=1 Tax=Polyopes affinis TaxID=194519 RepID=UPI002A81F9DB|nr:cytochrome c biogenesis protein [Polyopes affinis]WOL36977.1 cytochrome c biogenesis protein [Polyopes affinis]
MNILSGRNIVWYILKIIGSLNFAIVLLLLIASISVLGTVVEQDQNLLYYQINYPIDESSFFSFNWHTITFFRLDHLYSNWWFLSIIFLFFLSLMICTFSRQLPSLNNSRNWKFLHKENSMKKFKVFKSFDYKSISNIIYALHNRHYYVFHKGNSIYAYKGLVGRIAPIFVHFSIILTLIGAMFGLFGGFIVQKMIPEDEIFHIDNVIKSGIQSKLPYNIIGHVNDFDIDYNYDGSIKQFFSSISLLDSQRQDLVTKRISVNSPLQFRNLTFYQTDWRINSLRFRIGNAPIMQKGFNLLQSGNKSIWFCNLPLNTDQSMNIVITGLQSNIFIYNSEGSLIKVCSLHDTVQIYNTSLILEEIMTSTGLQIKVDPGVNLVYFGFFILIISVIVSYLSYSQIWVKSIASNINLAGSTNRAALAFEEDFTAVQRIYTYYIFKDYMF